MEGGSGGQGDRAATEILRRASAKLLAGGEHRDRDWAVKAESLFPPRPQCVGEPDLGPSTQQKQQVWAGEAEMGIQGDALGWRYRWNTQWRCAGGI